MAGFGTQCKKNGKGYRKVGTAFFSRFRCGHRRIGQLRQARLLRGEKPCQGRLRGHDIPGEPKDRKALGHQGVLLYERYPRRCRPCGHRRPAASVPGTLQEFGQKMVKGVVLITAGYKEIEDSQGEVLERDKGDREEI